MNAKNNNGDTALIIAAWSKKREVFDFSPPPKGMLVELHWVVKPESLEIVQALIAAGADVNAKNKDGTTALMRAREQGTAELIELLEKAEASAGSKGEKDPKSKN